MASSSGSSSTATTTSDVEHHTIRFFQGARPDAAANYELLSHLGRGAYGEVWAAKDPDDHSAAGGGKVAIKKINNAFCQATEAKRILRELRILRHLDHPNIIKIREVLRPQSESAFSDLWVVFDFVDLDLRKLIASPQTITVPHVQWICHQMLVGLQYLHSAHVLHRDLKPANVLLSERCEVKLCDFGLARVVDESDWALNEQRERAAPALARRCSSENPLERKPPPQISRQMTSHVVTRWYRAPELILLQRYTAAIDVWSFACIFAELLTMLPEARVDRRDRGALFPGRSCLPLSPVEDDANPEPNLDQLNVIFSVLGTPQGPLGWIELPEMRDYLHSLSPLPPTPLAELYPAAPAAALELLEATPRPESLSVVEYSLLIVDG
uniref:Mitogen-activated protein kinase n=1 Tax=Emiliania huxleyi TaxID=2903 RepID=A0A6V2SN52_EMIHU